MKLNQLLHFCFAGLLMLLFTQSLHAQQKELPLPGETFTVAGCTAFIIYPDKLPADSAAIPGSGTRLPFPTCLARKRFGCSASSWQQASP